jgi:ribonuclease VapC
VRLLSAASLLEASIVLQLRAEAPAVTTLDELVRDLGLIVVPFDQEQAFRARDAYREYGRGSRHPAQLNFGDCFSYPLAKITGEPLLCTRNDFQRTDIAVVPWQ